MTSSEQWRYVATEDNPADFVSRGMDSLKLKTCELWWNGPKFLMSNQYPQRQIPVAVVAVIKDPAVHLDIVTDLTSNAFIATLKRFIFRRGKCAKLYSDNATNFVGANIELKKMFNLVCKPDEALASYMASEGIDWKFLPPRAPNFGGLWEAGVKSFKFYLKRVVELGCITDPTIKQQSSERKHPSSPTPKKAKTVKLAYKVMTIICFDCEGITRCRTRYYRKWLILRECPVNNDTAR
ncbi:integrase catalytic domain-containing protein [Trichonephila clavipes]|nr:integrase catalytic domain-containing protein [Trichonephila clavipes]